MKVSPQSRRTDIAYLKKQHFWTCLSKGKSQFWTSNIWVHASLFLPQCSDICREYYVIFETLYSVELDFLVPGSGLNWWTSLKFVHQTLRHSHSKTDHCHVALSCAEDNHLWMSGAQSTTHTHTHTSYPSICIHLHPCAMCIKDKDKDEDKDKDNLVSGWTRRESRIENVLSYYEMCLNCGSAFTNQFGRTSTLQWDVLLKILLSSFIGNFNPPNSLSVLCKDMDKYFT